MLKTASGDGLILTIHPSYHAWSYAALLEGFNEAVNDKIIEIRPCAYLHNYVSDGIIDSAQYEPHISTSGTKGFDLNCTDKETAQYFESRLSQHGNH